MKLFIASLLGVYYMLGCSVCANGSIYKAREGGSTGR